MHSHGVRACRERGLHLMIVEEVDTPGSDALRYLENSLRQMRYDGVIVSQLSGQPAILDLLERMKIRYVRMSPTTDHGRSDSVTSNVAQGLKLLAEPAADDGKPREVVCPVRMVVRESTAVVRTPEHL